VTPVEVKSGLDRISDLADIQKNLVTELGILGVEIDPRAVDADSGLRDPYGIVVAAKAAGARSEIPLLPRDVIRAVNNTKIYTLNQLRTTVRELKPGAPVTLQLQRDGVKSFAESYDQLIATLEERLRIPGLDPRRADLAPAGAVLLDTILQRLGADDLTLCDLALREGLVLDYIRRHQKEIVHIETIPDVRRRSVLELAERCNYYADHARHIVQLSLALFDQTRALHGLTDREREWLEYAALMHDIGSHISFGRHHRHSYYLITNGDLRGFQPEEIEIMALVARYHRRSTPKPEHEEYARLSSGRRRTVRTLSAILRVAENLDRSHSQVISGLTVRARKTDVRLEIAASGDAELEMWATGRHVAPFEEVVGRPVRLVQTGTRRPAAKPAPAAKRRKSAKG